jgi:hydrogenase maturation protein HypF
VSEVRKGIEVFGIVQGVGFRPHAYRLASERQLIGTIANTGAGVAIDVQGPRQAVADFLAHLATDAPPLARITGVKVRDLPDRANGNLRILPSREGVERRALLSADVAVCDDCLRELADPADRRYRYPFINCTNCGPRFTIAHDIPYDRHRTTMAAFPMCPDCLREYEEPRDRRFHAQANACWTCGPQAALWDRDGRCVETSDPIAEAAARLAAGAVVAVKGLGGFHLAVDATDDEAVQRLRRRKGRVGKPFAVMAPDLDTIAGFCEVGEEARGLLTTPERPIVLLPRRRKPSPIADDVAPRQARLGVFLPYTPLHHLLFLACGSRALVMTSANLSEEPIAIHNDEALQRLHGLADLFLVHDRKIARRCDDSVIAVVAGRPRPVRRSRGYVPVPIPLHVEGPPVLAVGGELKNTVCFTKGRLAFLSQHVGDLENTETYASFEETVAHLQRVLRVEPQVVAYDLHPDYFATRWALAQKDVRCVGVQHHHAHIASCMAENRIEGPVIGLALDGTGYGTDGRIWGGEALVADYAAFERVAHLAYVPMPGGEAAIREPWRMALAYLAHHFERSLFDLPVPFVEQLDRGRADVLLQMLRRGVNSPLTSSCGRLFDAVAALLGIRQRVTYEGQAAIELEMAIDGAEGDAAYPLGIVPDGACWQIDTQALFEHLVADLRHGVPRGEMSLRFHNALVHAFARLAGLLRERTDLRRVCLSGGSFQNAYLLAHLQSRLLSAGFAVYTHERVPAGDGGLSLGQAMVAAHGR